MASKLSDFFASAAATAQALTTSYVDSDINGGNPGLYCDGFNTACIYLTTSGTAATSIEWRVLFRDDDDDAPVWFTECGSEISVGVVTHQEIVRGILDDTGACATGMTQCVHVDLGANLRIKMDAKRTGGAADTALLAQIRFAML